MTSRERVQRAIRFRGPDRVPHFLPDEPENDLIWLWSTRPAPRQDWTRIGDWDEMIDHWGTVFRRMAGGVIGRGEVHRPVLPDVTRQASYEIPDMHRPELLAGMEKAVAENRDAADPKYVLGVAPYCSLNEGVHNLMGLQNLCMAYYDAPEDLKAFIGRLADAQAESIRLLAAMGCDGVMFYDDWGLQENLMISKELIEEFFMPHYRRNWGLARELGLDVWLHSCGYIVELLDDFIEAGLHVIQQDQQENMGIDVLNKRFGGRLAFWCPVDIQRTMIDGTLDEIRSYATRMVETLGSHNGGFVSMAYSEPEAVNHTPEKLAAMCEAFRVAERMHEQS